MDMFMDKLAQKLTAQEMIKANTAADTEELYRLRYQITEYNECLDKLQKLIDDATAKLQEFQGGRGETDGQSDELAQKVSAALRQSMAELKAHIDMELTTNLDAKLSAQLDELGKRMGDANAPFAEALKNVEKVLDEKLGQIDSQAGGKEEEQLTEKLASIDESIHKECVKVYRNVQAVVMEESEKQKETAAALSAKMEKSTKKTGAVLKVSVAALVVSLAGLALQILNILHILPF